MYHSRLPRLVVHMVIDNAWSSSKLRITVTVASMRYLYVLTQRTMAVNCSVWLNLPRLS